MSQEAFDAIIFFCLAVSVFVAFYALFFIGYMIGRYTTIDIFKEMKGE